MKGHQQRQDESVDLDVFQYHEPGHQNNAAAGPNDNIGMASPYGPPSHTFSPPLTPSMTDQYQYQQHHQQQQQHDDYQQQHFQPYQHQQLQYQEPLHDPSRPTTRGGQGPTIDFNPTGWTPGAIPGPTRPARYSGNSFFTNETPMQSRPASPGAGGQRLYDKNSPNDSLEGLQPPKNVFDSYPPSPMQQSQVSLAALLPGSPASSDKTLVNDDAIQFLHERDDSEIWKGWKRHFYKLTPFLTLLSTGCYLLYLGLRVYCVWTAQEERGTVYAAAWVFIAVEVMVAIPALLHNFWTMWALKKRNRPRLRLTGNEVPTVDICITCCGEDDDLVLDTVRAACDVDYPQDRFRVVVLDDGKSSGLESAMKGLALIHPNVVYIAREKIPGKPHHFKAGNLNNGIDALQRLPGGAGEYMAALDADMIPERDWLRAIMPHLLLDPKLALACPPQLFYNTPKSDPLAQSLDFFVHVIEPIKDAMGVAWCTGSGYIVRREALLDIGGFVIETLAEDVATSTRLLNHGWKTAFIHEPLQFGTVPDSLMSHLKQRTRWAVGTVDTSMKLNFCLWGKDVSNMSLAQRFSGFLYASLSLYTILLTVSMFAIPIILVMGKPLVAYANDTQFVWLIRACFLAFATNRLCEFALFIPAGYHTGQRGSRYQLWMAPYIAVSIVRSFFLPSWLGGQTQAFKPTGSLGSSLNERDPVNRANMFRRLFSTLFNFMAIFHLSFVYMTLVGVTLTTFRCFVRNTEWTPILKCLITHAFWPPVTFVFIISSLWVPIAYAIDPPSEPDRELLLNRDPKTAVAHPTEESKKIAFGGQGAWFELEYTATTTWTILVFIGSFILF